MPKKRETAAQKTDLIKVKLTPAQMENTFTVLATFRDDKKLALNRSTISFDAATYQEVAKQVIAELEQRKAALTEEYKKNRISNDQLDWTNKSAEAMAAKKLQAQHQGAVKAIEAAVRKIAFGDLESDEPERSVEDWLEQYQEEQWDAYIRKRDGDAPRGGDPPLLKAADAGSVTVSSTNPTKWKEIEYYVIWNTQKAPPAQFAIGLVYPSLQLTAPRKRLRIT